MRLSIQGAVGAPGFYTVSTDLLIEQALMRAGGPAGTANLGKLRIERGSEVIMEGGEVQQALIEGVTLDQLNLQAGDQIYLPLETQNTMLRTVGRYAAMIALPLIFGIRAIR